MKIEANRQRALALRAARQQQPQTAAAGCGKSSSLLTNNNVQSAVNKTAAGSFASSRPSSASTVVRQFPSTSCPRTSAVYSNKQTYSSSFRSRSQQPTTLADTSNRAINGRSAMAQSTLNGPVVAVKCCLISRQEFAADARYSAPLVEIFKSIPSKQYGDESGRTCFLFRSFPKF